MKHKQNSVSPKKENETRGDWKNQWRIEKYFQGWTFNMGDEHEIKSFIASELIKEREKTLNEVKHVIDLMWDKDETDKNRYSVGWNSALAELLARLEVKSTAKGE